MYLSWLIGIYILEKLASGWSPSASPLLGRSQVAGQAGPAGPAGVFELLSEAAQSWLTLCDPMDCRLQTSRSMEFSRQKYWSGLPFPPPGELPNPEFKPLSPESPALQADSLLLSHWGSPIMYSTHVYTWVCVYIVYICVYMGGCLCIFSMCVYI